MIDYQQPEVIDFNRVNTHTDSNIELIQNKNYQDIDTHFNEAKEILPSIKKFKHNLLKKKKRIKKRETEAPSLSSRNKSNIHVFEQDNFFNENSKNNCSSR